MPNRFYVPPGADVSQGLKGIGQTLMENTKQRKADEENERKINEFAKTKMGAIEALKSGDPGKVAEFSASNPNFSNAVMGAFGLKQGKQKEELKAAYAQFLGNPTREALEILNEEKKQSNIPGVEGSLERFDADPDAWINGERMTFSTLFPNESKIMFGGGTKAKMQKTGAFLIKDPNTGETSIATGVFDPDKGTLETKTASINGADIVSSLGETAEEQTDRKILEARKKTLVSGEESRASALIERGVSAAESTAVIRRGIELLGSVETGGYEAVKLKAKQLFGIESANEGELSNSLGKAVLSQLRETFGAAFTENEGKRLSNIEASFGKSAAANKRLLKQALIIAERTARRAREAAIKREDMDTVDDIDYLLKSSLTPPEEYKEGQRARNAAGVTIIFRNGKWGPE